MDDIQCAPSLKIKYYKNVLLPFRDIQIRGGKYPSYLKYFYSNLVFS